jgi:DNA-binding LytR/AlgR family response regulator
MRQTPPNAAHASPTGGPRWRTTGAVAVAAALFLALSGAFDTHTVSLPVRLGYWFLALGVGSAVGVALTEVMRGRGWLRHGPVPTVLLISVAMSAPVTLLVWALSGWLLDGGFDPARIALYGAPVLVVTLAVTAVNVAVSGRAPLVTHAEALAPGEAAHPVRFLERLPRKLAGARLLAVEAQDHYLRLHTDRGSDLILMRLSDAIAELDGVEGAQTHRSWWVAKDAVTETQRGDGRAVLTLDGGLEAPVSRTYAKALREAGWF